MELERYILKRRFVLKTNIAEYFFLCPILILSDKC
jgi:hypothetical protein